MYAVGIVPHSRFPTYTLLLSDDEWERAEQRPRLSNRLSKGTLIFNDQRIFHDVSYRLRGSPFSRHPGDLVNPDPNWRVFFGADSLDGRNSLVLDGATNLRERLTYWLLDSLGAPTPRQHFAYFQILDHGVNRVVSDTQKIGPRLLDDWYASIARYKKRKAYDLKRAALRAQKGDSDDAAATEPGEDQDRQQDTRSAAERDGQLHKIDDYFDLTRKIHGQHNYIETLFRYTSSDPEAYRWNFPMRGNRVREDYAHLVKLVRLMDPDKTSNRQFARHAANTVDVDSWMKVLATRGVVNDWDSFGLRRGKNGFIYRDPSDGHWHLIAWDVDHSWSSASYSTVFSEEMPSARNEKFASIARILTNQQYARLFYGYMEFIARTKLHPAKFATILTDFKKSTGMPISRFRDFADDHRAVVLRDTKSISNSKFTIKDVKRLSRKDTFDTLKLAGTAPLMARRFQLDGREGIVKLVGRSRWVAEFPIGPKGGKKELRVLNIEGGRITSVQVRVRPRKNALPLPTPEPISEDITLRKARSLEQIAMADEVEEANSTTNSAATEPTVTTDSTPSAGDKPTVHAEPEENSETIDSDSTTPSATETAKGVAPADDRSTEPNEAPQPTRSLREKNIGVARKTSPPPLRTPFAPLDEQTAAEQTSSSRWILVIAGAVAAVFVAVTLLFLRSKARDKSRSNSRPHTRRKKRGEAPRSHTAESSVARALNQLAGEFENAEANLEWLWDAAGQDIPALIDTLKDERVTPFRKVRRTSEGAVYAVPAENADGIRLASLAVVLLRRQLGVPPVSRPSAKDWLAHWRSLRGED